MSQFLPIAYIVGWFGLIFGASYLINWLLIRSIIRRYYRLFVAPGVLVHELSHALGCLITGAQITEINFWKVSGGHVKHYEPRLPLLGEAIIALAPIWGTFLVLSFLTWLMAPQILDVLQGTTLATIVDVIDITKWQTWLYLYLVTSLVATIAPSKTDMTYALGSLVVLAVTLSVLLFFLPDLALSLDEWGELTQPYALFTLGLLGVGIVVAFLLALPNRNKHFAPRNQIE